MANDNIEVLTSAIDYLVMSEGQEPSLQLMQERLELQPRQQSEKWSNAELAIIREAKDRWDRESLLKMIADVQAVNKDRSVAAIKIRLVRERRGGDGAHPAVRARVLERWAWYVKCEGGLTNIKPADVLAVVNNGLVLGPRFRCSPRLFTVESIRGRYLPPDFDWHTLVQEIKKCPKCEREREKEYFGYDDTSVDGLKRYCLDCRNEFVKNWRKGVK